MGKLKTQDKVTAFSLEGRFVGFVGEVEETPKRIRVATLEGERKIKLSKELGVLVRENLAPGDWIQVFGEQKFKQKTGELKLKAYQVTRRVPQGQQGTPQHPVTPAKTTACVMVCQKSSCCKRGAIEVCQAVGKSLRDRGLADRVVIKQTGCMKQCKKGPCVVFMPDKSRYVGVDPKVVPTLVEQHFVGKLKPEESEPQLSPVT